MEKKEDNSLNTDKLGLLLLQSEQSIQSASAQDIVLVIGMTGSGKSTTISYFHEGDMEPVQKLETGDSYIINKLVNQFPNRFPKIGHGQSETSFPKAYQYPEKIPFALCDTAGFGDTRGTEEDICTYLACSIAVQAARSVKAIVIVIDEKALDLDRGGPFSKVLGIVGELLTEESLYSNVFFAFTKGKRTREQLLKKLKNRADQLAATHGIGRKSLSNENLELDDKQKVINAYAMMERIRKYPQNVFAINPMDKTKGSQHPLIQTIKKIPPINIKKLGLLSNHRDMSMVKRWIFKEARVFCNSLSTVEKSKQKIDDKRKSISKNKALKQEKTSELEKFKSKKQSAQDVLKSLEEDLSKLDLKKKEYNKNIQEKKEQLKSLENKLIRKRQEGKEQVSIYKYSYCEHTTHGTVPVGIVNTHQFLYEGDLPVCSEKCQGANQTITTGSRERFDHRENSSKHFSIVYYTPSHTYGRATVELFTDKKNTQEFKSVLQEIEDDKLEIKTDIKDLNEKITNLDRSFGILEKINSHKNKLSKEADLIQALTDTVKQCQDELNAAKKAIESFQSEIKKHEIILKEKEAIFDMIVRLSGFFPSQIMSKFLEKHTDFYPGKRIKSYLEWDDSKVLEYKEEDVNIDTLEEQDAGWNENDNLEDINIDTLNMTNLNQVLMKTQDIYQLKDNQRVFLMVGSCGSGKSTLLNYLNGGDMEEEENEAGDTIIVNLKGDDTPFFPKIRHEGSGSSFNSPHLYPVKGRGQWVVCDTPGFNSPISLENKIANGFSLKEIIRTSPYIGGIIVVVETAVLYMDRGKEKELVNYLKYLIDNIKVFDDSVLFVFNGDTKNVNQLKKKMETLLKKYKDKEEHQDLVIFMNLAMKNFIKLDMSQDKSKNIIFDFMERSKTVDKVYFSGSHFPVLKSIEKALWHNVKRLNSYYDSKMFAQEALKQLEADLTSQNLSLSEKQKLLKGFESEETMSLQVYKNYLEKAIQDAGKQQSVLSGEFKSVENRIQNLAGVRDKLINSNEEVLVWKQEHSDRKQYSNWQVVYLAQTLERYLNKEETFIECKLPSKKAISEFKCYEKSEDKENKNVLLTRSGKSGEGVGEFSIFYADLRNGEITVKYKTDKKYDKIGMDVYIKDYDTEESQIYINNLHDNIKTLESRRSFLNRRIKELEKERESLKKQMSSDTQTNKEIFKSMKSNLEITVNHIKKGIDECRGEMERKKQLINLFSNKIKTIQSQCHLVLELVNRCPDIINQASDMFKNFKKIYQLEYGPYVSVQNDFLPEEKYEEEKNILTEPKDYSKSDILSDEKKMDNELNISPSKIEPAPSNQFEPMSVLDGKTMAEQIDDLMEDEGYIFQINKKDSKNILITLTNTEDLGIDKDMLQQQFQKLKETLKKTIETDCNLKHGRKKDFFLGPDFKNHALKVSAKDPENLKKILNYFVEKELLEAEQLKEDIVKCPIL